MYHFDTSDFMEKYELYLILNPNLSADDVNVKVDIIINLLEKEMNAENIELNNQGLRKLAYPIKKNTTGYYLLFNFSCPQKPRTIGNVEKKLNVSDFVLRYLITNQTEFLVQKAKETLRETEAKTHRDLNKGKIDKKCILKHIGYRVVDYKDVEFLQQFTSPYAKIFSTDKTGTSSKYQRKVKQAIKRARHMALMPFTSKYQA